MATHMERLPVDGTVYIARTYTGKDAQISFDNQDEYVASCVLIVRGSTGEVKGLVSSRPLNKTLLKDMFEGAKSCGVKYLEITRGGDHTMPFGQFDGEKWVVDLTKD